MWVRLSVHPRYEQYACQWEWEWEWEWERERERGAVGGETGGLTKRTTRKQECTHRTFLFLRLGSFSVGGDGTLLQRRCLRLRLFHFLCISIFRGGFVVGVTALVAPLVH